ncbi:MAG: M23 family metallopeptidase [Chloroflexi bacterium]|nr:MAG: M23 family metallopeptidase [Chloroflexota bacterium]
MRIVLGIVGVVLFGAVAVTASNSTPSRLAAPTVAPRYTPVPGRENPPPEVVERLARSDGWLAGMFSSPIEGVEIPDDPNLLPGAPRDYRAGTHEGIDFPAPLGTPVLAAANGTVIRVDAGSASSRTKRCTRRSSSATHRPRRSTGSADARSGSTTAGAWSRVTRTSPRSPPPSPSG